jgi:hypothetical protein
MYDQNPEKTRKQYDQRQAPALCLYRIFASVYSCYCSAPTITVSKLKFEIPPMLADTLSISVA